MEHSLLVNVHKEFWLLYFRASHAKAFPFSKKESFLWHLRSLQVIYFCICSYLLNKPLFIDFIHEQTNLKKKSPSLVNSLGWGGDWIRIYCLFYLSLRFFSVEGQKKNPILLFNVLSGDCVQNTKYKQIRSCLQLKCCIWSLVNVKLSL